VRALGLLYLKGALAGEGASRGLRGGTGRWWRTPLRPTVKFEQLKQTLDYLKQTFPAEMAHVQAYDVEADAIAAAKRADAFCGGSSFLPRTLLHGDSKPANFFISAGSSQRAAHRELLGVVGIDYQWCGLATSGLGDVVYLLLGGVRYDTLASGKEGGLHAWREFYIDKFMHHLMQQSAPANSVPSREWLHDQWAAEVLDYCATALPYLCGDLTSARLAKNADKHGYLEYERDARALAGMAQEMMLAWRCVRRKGQGNAQ
jgi:hypothetical protein